MKLKGRAGGGINYRQKCPAIHGRVRVRAAALRVNFEFVVWPANFSALPLRTVNDLATMTVIGDARNSRRTSNTVKIYNCPLPDGVPSKRRTGRFTYVLPPNAFVSETVRLLVAPSTRARGRVAYFGAPCEHCSRILLVKAIAYRRIIYINWRVNNSRVFKNIVRSFIRHE